MSSVANRAAVTMAIAVIERAVLTDLAARWLESAIDPWRQTDQIAEELRIERPIVAGILARLEARGHAEASPAGKGWAATLEGARIATQLAQRVARAGGRPLG